MSHEISNEITKYIKVTLKHTNDRSFQIQLYNRLELERTKKLSLNMQISSLSIPLRECLFYWLPVYYLLNMAIPQRLHSRRLISKNE